MTEITCVYSRTAAGRHILAFTADLWRRLGCSLPLQVQVHSDNDSATLQAKAVEKKLIKADIAEKTGLPPEAISLTTAFQGDIIVDHNLAFQRQDLSILYPARESTLLKRGQGPILVPFGDGQSALPAATMAYAMAARLSLPVVLYHTTWVDPQVTETEAKAHMCKSAQDVLSQLRAQAEEAGIEVTEVIETADDVVEGLLNCAMRQSAVLIVMSRSAKTRIGCYVAQTLTKTPVPILALSSARRKQQ